MRNVFFWLGIALAAFVFLASLIHIADAYLITMLAGAVVMLGIGASSWPQP